MKKMAVIMSLFIILGSTISCSQGNGEIDYYKPTIKEEYKEISKDEFVNVVKEKYNTNFNYQYAGVKVKYNDETDISNKHFRAKLKSDLSLENGDYLLQSIKKSDSRDNNEAHKKAEDSIKYYKNPLKNIESASKFYSNPFSYDIEDSTYSRRYIFDDSFIINKIEISSYSSNIECEYHFYNYTGSQMSKGEISLESYLDIGYARLERDKTVYSRVDANVDIKNGLVDINSTYVEEGDYNLQEPIYGDVKIKFSRYMQSIGKDNFGIENYQRSTLVEEAKIIEGNISDKVLQFIIEPDVLKIGSNSCMVDFNTPLYETNKSGDYSDGFVRQEFFASPLSRKIYRDNKVEYLEYDTNGAVVKYINELVEEPKGSYEYNFIYS